MQMSFGGKWQVIIGPDVYVYLEPMMFPLFLEIEINNVIYLFFQRKYKK